jgi:hypothetical protein
MTKKHFKALAEELRTQRPLVDPKKYEQWRQDIEAIARACKNFNPQFSTNLFLEACEL